MKKAISTVNSNENTDNTKARNKEGIKNLPELLESPENFRAYLSLYNLLTNEAEAENYNALLKSNKLLTIKQSVDNYKKAGIDLEAENYPFATTFIAFVVGINRKRRVIFGGGVIGERKLAITATTRTDIAEIAHLKNAQKAIDRRGYSRKSLDKIEDNNGVIVPAGIGAGYMDSAFDVPYLYTLSNEDVKDFNQWTSGGDKKFAEVRKLALPLETVDYDDKDNCVAEFVDVARRNGFEIYQYDVLKVALTYRDYLQSVIDGANFSEVQKSKARDILFGTVDVVANVN